MAENRNSVTFSNSKYKSKPNSISYKPRPKQERSSSSSSDKACVVCYRDVKYHSVGACEHPVCYECSARMRVLLEQNECPICRQTLEHVIFTNGIKSYAELKDKIRMFVLIPTWSIYLEDETIQASFENLLEHKCFLCSDLPTFPQFEGLREHTQRKHQLYACDLCVEHIKHFSKERKFYSRSDLALHKRKGDRNDTSHRGHPLCKFCDKRFFDNDELFKHLRKDHYYCHFCDADGYNHYYNTYDDLRIHYRKEHFLCEEEHCAEEKFTSVFRTEIDLKAHLASAHSRLLGKHGTKQARTLEIEFALPKRPENERGRFGKPYGYGTRGGRDDDRGDRDRRNGRERDRAGNQDPSPATIGATDTVTGGDTLMGEIHQVPSIHVQPKMDSAVDFPTLDVGGATGGNATSAPGSSNGSSLAQKMALASGLNVRVGPVWKAGMKREEEFPVLGGGPAPVPPPGSIALGSYKMSTAQPNRSTTAQTKPRGATPELDFPTLPGRSSVTSGGNASKVWQGSGPGGKLKLNPSSQDQVNGQVQPKAKKVAPCPVIPEQNSTTVEKDFNFVPLSVSNRSTKSNGAKSVPPVDVFEMPEEVETETKNSSSGKKNKKKGDSSNQKEKVLALAAATLFNGGTAPPKTSHKSKLPAVEAEFPSLPTPVPRKTVPSKKTPKGPQTPPVRKISPPPGFQLKRNDDLEDELRVESPPPPKPSPKIAPTSTKAPSKPPPGFETMKPPSIQECTDEVNFLNSVLQLGEISIPKNGEYRMYIQPSDMKARNDRLLEAIRSSLNSDESTFDSFLSLATLFRKNEIPAKEYYDLCSSMFGTLDFRVIFSELVVLLPDIQKQQELLVTHRNSGGKGELLSTCHICHQVLKKGDVTFHMQAHSSETESFPSLGNVIAAPSGKK